MQSAATRDHALSSMTSTPSALTHAAGASAPSTAPKGHHSHVSVANVGLPRITKLVRIEMFI